MMRRAWVIAIGLLSLAGIVVGYWAILRNPSTLAYLPPSAEILILKGVTVISPERERPLNNGYVAIANGVIHDVGEWNDAMTVPQGTSRYSGDKPLVRIIDLTGKFIIPGLIDGHVHVAAIPGFNDALLAGLSADERITADAAIARYRQQLPRSYLYFGYTTLVDLNVVDRGALDAMRAAPVAPELYDCDAGLPVVDGYPMRFASSEQRWPLFPNFLIDAARAVPLPATIDPQQHTVAAAIARVKAHGGICVKSYYEDGFGAHNDWPTPSAALLHEIVTTAHDAQLVTLLHANSLTAQQRGVDARFDILAHGMWNWESSATALEQAPAVQGTLDRIIAQRIGYMPTFQVLGGIQALFDAAYWAQSPIAQVIPLQLQQWYDSPAGQRMANILRAEEGEGMSLEQAYLALNQPLERLRQVVHYLSDHNARLLFGTDTPSSPTYGNLPGLNGLLEMRRWYDAGVPLPKILRAATIDNAAAFHMAEALGTIEIGKRANLVVLTADPLLSVDAYDAIDAVIVHGQLFPRAELSALSPHGEFTHTR